MNKYFKFFFECLPLKWKIQYDLFCYYRLQKKFNASLKTNNDCHKMQYTLLRETHVIEKGLSMRSPKYAFGKNKVNNLIDRLLIYANKYFNVDNDFLNYPLSVINHYISYMKNQGVDIKEINDKFQLVISKYPLIDLSVPSGVYTKDKDSVQTNCRLSFKELLSNRHSIRYFLSEEPSDTIISSALELAQMTPSACNRQAWHTHVYKGKKCKELLNMQGGCNGFFEELSCAIIVTTDLKGFLSYEPFQCYIDGGLYSMNLINSLHYLGLGTIPLSCGFHQNKLESIKRKFNIPKNEVLILIVGVGYLEDSFKVAVSTRKPISITNTFHR